MTLRKLLDWQALSADYSQYHRTAGNRACHLMGIPLILLSLIAWTQWPAGNPVPLVAGLLPVYFFWDIKLAAGMVLEVAALSWIALHLPSGAPLAAFILGWVLQLAGHKVFEGKSPAFTKNLAHLLVGPAWILQKFLG